MSLHEAYDAILEDTVCPVCGTVGMLPDGGFDYECPNCGASGTVLDDQREDDEENEDEDDNEDEGGF